MSDTNPDKCLIINEGLATSTYNPAEDFGDLYPGVTWPDQINYHTVANAAWVDCATAKKDGVVATSVDSRL